MANAVGGLFLSLQVLPLLHSFDLTSVIANTVSKMDCVHAYFLSSFVVGLLRCGKSCRLRWTNYLRPDLKRGMLSEEEEKMVIELHSQLGNRHAAAAPHLPSSFASCFFCLIVGIFSLEWLH